MQVNYITPAVTAFDSQGHVDMEANKKLYDHLINNGISGILILGSIGEFYAISTEEKKRLIQQAIAYIGERAAVYVGTGTTIFEECVDLTNYAVQEGASGVAVISPYYFTHSDEEMFDFYAKLAESTTGNILLYNFPARTGYQLSADTVLKLAKKYPNIIGIKDTVGEMGHTRELIQVVKKERPDFLIYSGFDEFFFHNILSGGDGCIAGLSNIAPAVASAMVKAATENDLAKVSQYQQKLDGLMALYGIQSQFVPIIKQAVNMVGVLLDTKCLFPMTGVSEENKMLIEQILKKQGIAGI